MRSPPSGKLVYDPQAGKLVVQGKGGSGQQGQTAPLAPSSLSFFGLGAPNRSSPSVWRSRIDQEQRKAIEAGGPQSLGKGVDVVDLFSSVSIEKNYGAYTMVYDGRFRKLVKGTSAPDAPSEAEIDCFKAAIGLAARYNRKVLEFVKKHPELKELLPPEGGDGAFKP
jgi:hypothetical protein